MSAASAGLLEVKEEVFWAEYARVYETVLTRFSAYRDLVERIVTSQPPPRRVLDVGCGPGIVSRALVANGCRVVGVDYNPEMVRLSGARSGDYRRMDAAALDFEDGSFEGVVSNNVLYFVPDPVAALAEMHRVLAPGGLLTLSAPRAGFDMRVLDRQLARDVDGCADYPLREAHAEFLAFNRQLDTGGMRNLFEPDALVRLLLDRIGFARVVRHELAYLEQSYFLVLAKSENPSCRS